MTVHLSADEARSIAVRAQLLDADKPGDVVEVAEQLTAIKIDPTKVIAPAEHTILFSRIGWSYEPAQLRKATEMDRLLFEFDGAFRPISVLPMMRPKMRLEALHASSRNWVEANHVFHREILARLRAEGPLPASAIPDTAAVAHRSESGWYGPNQVPRMLEILQRAGDVAVVRREGRTKVWDLAERVYPAQPELSADDAASALADRRLKALGIAKAKSPWSRVGMAGVAATVQGSAWKFRVDPEALEALDTDAGGRVALLNPYDSVLFDRPRLQEIFGFTYVLEQFKPKAERRFGYFAHPILIGDRFAGLLDAEHRTADDTLVVTAVHELDAWEPEEHDMVRQEIRELADWLGAEVRGLE
ncbi:crosslink repair DNA glycosylase YcaQ family protein [Microbacterium sp. NC79]|uniref:DNA glycosylase AlkZ-like family protein n=1 Tax=Microbacterium sp. NC79 TaxID=2851009 RepID=UPI00349F4582